MTKENKVKRHLLKRAKVNRSHAGNFVVFAFIFVLGVFMAIPLVYGLQACKRALFGGKPWVAALWGVGLCCAIAGLWKLNKTVDLDYGFWGTMLPVAASLFRQKEDAPLWVRRLDCNLVHVLAMAVAMVPLALDMGQWQWWSFLAVPLLMAYSGKRGKLPMKYFFYIFYPAHLAVLEGIAMLIN